MSDSWTDISPGPRAGAITLRRADADHPLDFFRGRDHQGRYLFMLQGDLATHAGAQFPRLSSMEIALSSDASGVWSLSITLLDTAHAEVFRALCSNLMEATSDLRRGEEEKAVGRVLMRLNRWQQLLQKMRERKLTRAEIIGLYGELVFLRDMFLARLSPGDAVAAWRGPHKDEQDFLLGDWMIEVKTQLTSSDSRLQISSENQLDRTSGNILVCHQTLGIGSESDAEASTLNEIVTEIIDMLGMDFVAVDRFQSTLVENRYMRLDRYDEDHWRLNERSYFKVTEGFPSITPGMLPEGVQTVRYDIKLDACEPFRVSEEEATEWVTDNGE